MKQHDQKKSFSLIEVNLAILLIAVGLLSLFSLFPLGLKESERGLADTQEAMFADTVLSVLEGNSMNMTNWADWASLDKFKSKVKEDAPTPAYYDFEGTNLVPVHFPTDTRYWIRYKLAIKNASSDGRRKSAQLHVMHGRHGDFGLATTYYTEFIYMGM